MVVRDGERYQRVEDCRAAAARIETQADRDAFVRNAGNWAAGWLYLASEEWTGSAWNTPRER